MNDGLARKDLNGYLKHMASNYCDHCHSKARDIEIPFATSGRGRICTSTKDSALYDVDVCSRDQTIARDELREINLDEHVDDVDDVVSGAGEFVFEPIDVKKRPTASAAVRPSASAAGKKVVIQRNLNKVRKIRFWGNRKLRNTLDCKPRTKEEHLKQLQDIRKIMKARI